MRKSVGNVNIGKKKEKTIKNSVSKNASCLEQKTTMWKNSNITAGKIFRKKIEK